MDIKKSPVLYIVLAVVVIIILVFVYFQLKSPATESESEAKIENCGEGTAIYQNNRLCWQRSVNPNKVSNWQEANTYCENLELGGRTDWRLPTADELKSLVDDSYSPAINPTYFLDTENINYWTSSLYRENMHWYIHFELGYQGFSQDFREDFGVRCVRDSTLL